MLRFVGRVFAAGLLLVAGATQAQVVISQVYGGGGNSGAPYNRDFIELHNNGTTSVSLGGLSLQYASGTGTGNFAIGSTLPTVNLAPGQYFLVGSGTAGATGVDLPAVDASGTSAMSGTAGKVVLVNSTSTLACNGSSTPCSGAQLALIVDLVGYGSANFFEGTAATPAPSNTTSVMRAGNGCTDTNNNGADFTAVAPAPRNTASTLVGCGGSGVPLLAISDVSAFEGDSGTSTMSFGFGLSAPAGVGGVSIDYTTADGTATAGSDYVAASGTLVIPEGSNSGVVDITINGDTVSEPDETFFVRATSATGATISDGEGLGTIQNDDVTVVSIAQIQGNGLISPLNNAIVSTEGIVTAQKFNNGFFLQSVTGDGDPATSDGIFVFTSTAPPATATVGNLVRVTGTVIEYTPSTNLNQLSITEIGFVSSIQVLSTGNTLPAPVVLTSADFSALSTPGTAEKYEGMRVTLPSAIVVDGSDGNISESSATSSTTGVFQVVLSDVDRPFREAGIGIMDTIAIPGGKNPPRFDTNQERLMVRSRGQIGASSLALDAETEITNMTGVLDYFSGTWAVLPDPASGTIKGGKTPTAVSDTKDGDVTIGAFNLLRFFDEVNNSNGAPTLTAAALDKRLTKTSAAICDYLKTPDILGVVEVENLRVLGLLADRINATCASAPAYVPYLVQGNDVGGINVGYLVSNASVGANARVEVVEVVQYGKDTVLNNPNSTTSLLNDRPPLMLRAIIHHQSGASYPITVFVNHLRSLNGIDDTAPGSSGWSTGGERVRTKRAQQAAYLANLVEARQQTNPNERIVLLGDFNAFEFNDGYADVMGIVRGNPVPESEVFTYLPSPITTPLIDGSDLIVDPAERYSYVYQGNAQTLDHVVVNEALLMDAAGLEVDHARINADFGVHNFGDVGNAIRVSDHDPVRLRISVAAFSSADLSVTASVSPASVNPGGTATFTAIATNNGPVDAASASIALVFDALVSPAVNAAAGWTCAAPVQATGMTTVTCTNRSFVNADSATFTASIVTDIGLSGRNLQMAAAVASQTNDPANGNNSASASVSVNVTGNANMSVSLLGGPVTSVGITEVGPARIGGQVVFVIPVRNIGPDFAIGARLVLTGDVPLANTALNIPAGWNCAQNATAGGFEMTCDLDRPLRKIAGEFFALGIVVPNRSGNLTVDASVSSLTPDPVAANNTAHRAFPIAPPGFAGPSSVSQPAIPGGGEEAGSASDGRADAPVAHPDVQPTEEQAG